MMKFAITIRLEKFEGIDPEAIKRPRFVEKFACVADKMSNGRNRWAKSNWMSLDFFQVDAL